MQFRWSQWHPSSKDAAKKVTQPAPVVAVVVGALNRLRQLQELEQEALSPST
jgi:hypothetical protein